MEDIEFYFEEEEGQEILPVYDVEFTDEEVAMLIAANPYAFPLDLEQVLDTGEEEEYTDNKPL